MMTEDLKAQLIHLQQVSKELSETTVDHHLHLTLNANGQASTNNMHIDHLYVNLEATDTSGLVLGQANIDGNDFEWLELQQWMQSIDQEQDNHFFLANDNPVNLGDVFPQAFADHEKIDFSLAFGFEGNKTNGNEEIEALRLALNVNAESGEHFNLGLTFHQNEWIIDNDTNFFVHQTSEQQPDLLAA